MDDRTAGFRIGEDFGVPETTGPLQDLSDEELMVRYAKGEEICFEILLNRYRRPVFGFLFRYLGRADRAEDVFQDVFFEVIRARKRFRPDLRFGAWLFRIARNRAVDRLRRNGLREMSAAANPSDGHEEHRQSAMEAVSDPDSSPEEMTRAAELRAALEGAMSGLPPEQREVLWLKERSGLTLNDIAQLTGVSQNTVKSRLRYALEKIRKTMIEMGYSP